MPEACQTLQLVQERTSANCSDGIPAIEQRPELKFQEHESQQLAASDCQQISSRCKKTSELPAIQMRLEPGNQEPDCQEHAAPNDKQLRLCSEEYSEPLKKATCPARQQEDSPCDEKINLTKTPDPSEGLRSGPLGPIPNTTKPSAPLEYWAPLAQLTKSRPAVENFSVTRYSPAELRLHNEALFNNSHESVHKEMFVKLLLIIFIGI